MAMDWAESATRAIQLLLRGRTCAAAAAAAAAAACCAACAACAAARFASSWRCFSSSSMTST